MTPASNRTLPFVAVGAAGFVVQLASLHALVAYGHVHYLAATALAVEAAILHNFVWHSRWTWRDRPHVPGMKRWVRLARFNGLSALSSIVGNVVVTGLFVTMMGLPVILANALAVAMVSALNFVGLDRWVYAPAVAVGRASSTPTTVMLMVLAIALPAHASAADLTAATRRAWQRYVATAEARIERELASPGPFLSLDFDAAEPRQRARRELRAGTVVIKNLEGEEGVQIPDGTIHHWRGAVFIPGATVHDVLEAVSDPTGARAHRQEDVLEARVLSRSPNALRLFLKLQRRVIVSATYNTEHQVTYRTHGSNRASSRSVATRIAEVVNAGEPDEHERPPGVDRGFMWGMNSYWRYESVPGGVIVELESLTLSRSVPWGVGTVVSPLVDRVARESLTRTLVALRARFAERALS
jgi:putative flippase GtrA